MGLGIIHKAVGPHFTSHLGNKLAESSCYLTVVTFLRGLPKGTLCVHTTDHVMELRGGEDSCKCQQ